MTSKQIAFLVIGIVLIIFSAFFSASDIIVSSCDNSYIKKKSKKNKDYKRAFKLTDDYPNTISTLLFSNNLVNIGISSIATTLSLSLFPNSNENVVSICTVVIVTLILLIFGEILPKTLTKPYSNKLITYIAPIVIMFKVIFFPFVFLTNKICNLITLPFTKYSKRNPEEKMGDDELIEMAETIKKEGIIDQSQEELLKNAIQFSDTKVFEIMTPRVDIIGIDINDYDFSKESSKKLLNYTRIIVYEDNLDKVIGVVNSINLLKKLINEEKINIKALMKKPFFVPRSLGIYETFKSLNENNENIAIVIDEYGGCEGIVTLEDILEELVGEIWDETDKVNDNIRKISHATYEVDGYMNIDDFFERFSIEKDENFDPDAYITIGGFITAKLEKFGEVGDIVIINNLRIKITKVSGKAIYKLEVKILKNN